MTTDTLKRAEVQRMMQRSVTHRFVLDNISWETYDRLLREVGQRHIRLTYDEGELEIMTLSFAHEQYGEFLASLLMMLTLELSIPMRSGGSTTLRRKIKRKGLEPDKCFWFQHESRMRLRKKWRPDRDPPPELALEIDVTRSWLDRMGIYAALGVAEVWRWNGRSLRVYYLDPQGKYRVAEASPLFPFLPLDGLVRFLVLGENEDQTTVRQRFAAWVRTEVLPRYQAWRQRGKNYGK
jgi:Uma2 family endonuclease